MGTEGETVELRWLREAAEVDQSGVDVEKADCFGAVFPGFDSGAGDEEWGSGGLFPEGALGPALFFAEVKPVIAPEDNDGVVFVRAVAQSLENGAYAMVGKAHAGEVGMHHFTPLLPCEDFGMCRLDVEAAFEVWREVVEIGEGRPGQRDLVSFIKIEPLLWNKHGNVRSEDSH